jgi:hypothetical protein
VDGLSKDHHLVHPRDGYEVSAERMNCRVIDVFASASRLFADVASFLPLLRVSSHHFSMVSRLDPLFDKLERITEANKLQAINVPQVIVLPVSPLNETANAAATASSSKEPESPVRPAAPSSSSLTTTSPSHSTAANSTSSSAAVAPIPLELTRDEITQLLNVLLHSADISNPGKPWRVAKVWSDRIQAENFSQGDLEKKRTLAISPFMDRAQENQPQTAINFIDFIVSPLMLAIVRAFPSLVPLAENLIKNRKM